jgi:hypothetical protein
MCPVGLWNNNINHERVLDNRPLVAVGIEFKGVVNVSRKARLAWCAARR